MCVLDVTGRGNPELEAHRDKLVVRMKPYSYHISHISHLRIRTWCLVGDMTSGFLGPRSHCSYSFLDINPLSRGHALVIPKCPVTSLSPLDVSVLKMVFLLFFWVVLL